MASWLFCSIPDRAVLVRALAERRVQQCAWARHLLSQCLSLHPGVKMGTGEFHAGGGGALVTLR